MKLLLILIIIIIFEYECELSIEIWICNLNWFLILMKFSEFIILYNVLSKKKNFVMWFSNNNKNCKNKWINYFVRNFKRNSCPYVYVNLTGGLMFCLSRKFRLGDDLLHMRFSFRFVAVTPNGLIWWTFTLKVFPFGFISSYALSDKILTMW